MNQGFIDKIKNGAIEGWTIGRILPSVSIAQGILESGWGESELAKNGNNLFGIKASDGWTGSTYTIKTAEYDKNNKKFYINAAFRKYNSWDESVRDHALFFHNPPWRESHYSTVIGETDYRKACQALQKCGYATSQIYANQLIGLIEKYNLVQYDKVALSGKGSVKGMKIFLSVGHSRLRGGGYTSASGFIHEYKYNKELAPYVKRALESLGHSCDVVICPEGRFTHWTQERGYKLPIANSGKYDLVCELHLNASNGVGNGVEVLHYPNDPRGRAIAERGAKALANLGFRNRGAKSRGDLYIIAQTNPTAVLFESFFCDNKYDTDLAKRVGFEKVANAIAYGLTGQTPKANIVTQQPTVAPKQAPANKPMCVMYFNDGNKITAEFIAQQLGCKCYKDNGRDLPNSEHSKYDIKYIGNLGKNRQETAKIALKKFLNIG